MNGIQRIPNAQIERKPAQKSSHALKSIARREVHISHNLPNPLEMQM